MLIIFQACSTQCCLQAFKHCSPFHVTQLSAKPHLVGGLLSYEILPSSSLPCLLSCCAIDTQFVCLYIELLLCTFPNTMQTQ